MWRVQKVKWDPEDLTSSVCCQMQENFSRSSVSCLVESEVKDSPAGDKTSDPCWQVTQQLHRHIEKVWTLLHHQTHTALNKCPHWFNFLSGYKQKLEGISLEVMDQNNVEGNDA